MSNIKIVRKSPREDVEEQPYLTARGYKMADAKFGREKHHAKHAVFVKTLDDVASNLSAGLHLWMTRDGKRPSLISPEMLQVVRF